MLVKYIDSNYIIEDLQKTSWGEVEEPDFYITMASNRVKALIFPSEQGDPNNLASYTEEQQEAIKLATAIYTLWYFDTNYDFTNGSVSVNFGGVSMSESKTYNGEMVLPNVFDILKQANLIPTTETFIFSGENNLYADTAINPKSFKDLQQEVERQADVNIKQDAKLVALNDTIANIDGLKTEIWDIQEEQQEQDTKILTNTNKITTLQNDVKTFYGDLLATQNKVAGIEYNYVQKNGNLQIVNAFVDFYGNIAAKNNGYVDNVDTGAPTSMVNIRHLNNTITPIDTKLTNTTDLLNQTIEGLRTLKPFEYVGQYQAGTTYNINQLVSLNNNLYLSTEDNNTTTPPTDKWLLLNEDMLNIDLTEYYTKLEVDGIKNNLQNDITANRTEIARVDSVVNTNSTNIVNLDSRATNLETNSLSKTTTTPQTIASQITFTQTDMVLKFNSGTNNSAYLAGFKSNNQRVWYFGKGSSTSDNFVIGADRGVIKLEPSTHVDVSGKRIINVATPTAINDAVNKQYVDTAIAGINTSGNVPQQTLDKINTNTTNITNLQNEVSGQAINITALQNQVNVNVNRIGTNANSINQLNTKDTQNVKLSGNQTINGQKTFANRIFANGGITNLPEPTNTSEAATKNYVDNKTGLYTLFSSNTIYNNLQKITTRLFDNSAVDYNKPLTVSFTRTNTSGADYGSYVFQIKYGIGENNFVVGSNLYYDRSKTYGQLGDWVALTLTPSYIQVQCWNGGDRIKNIKVQGWKKV